MCPAVHTPSSIDRVAPIPPMPEFYGDEGQRQGWVRRLFDDTAPDYERIERWLSLGSGGWYRRQALLRAGLGPGMSVADVGTGTGLVAREAMKVVGSGGRVLGIDPSEGMLRAARAALGIEGRVAWAERLPLGDGEVEFVSMGYALRHLSSLEGAFGEFARVLKPGGRVCILEVTKPVSRLGAGVLRGYMTAMSSIACLATNVPRRNRELWRYYWETIDRCVPPERVLAALREAGFADASRSVSLGIFSEYTGTRGSS